MPRKVKQKQKQKQKQSQTVIVNVGTRGRRTKQGKSSASSQPPRPQFVPYPVMNPIGPQPMVQTAQQMVPSNVSLEQFVQALRQARTSAPAPVPKPDPAPVPTPGEEKNEEPEPTPEPDTPTRRVLSRIPRPRTAPKPAPGEEKNEVGPLRVVEEDAPLVQPDEPLVSAKASPFPSYPSSSSSSSSSSSDDTPPYTYQQLEKKIARKIKGTPGKKTLEEIARDEYGLKFSTKVRDDKQALINLILEAQGNTD